LNLSFLAYFQIVSNNIKITKDVEIFVLSDGEINEAIENKNQTIIETNIQEYKAKTTMY
jgi:hypothetical protein